MNRDGSEPRQLTPISDDKQIGEFGPRFSPDGKWIYYALFRSSQSSVYKISIEGGEPIQVLRADKGTYEPSVSPNGKWLAFAVQDDKAKQPWFVGAVSLENGEEKSFDFPAFRFRTRWMPDSESVVWIEQSFNGANLWQTNLKTGARRQVTNFKAERIYHFDVSPDGRFFVVSRGNEFNDAVLIER
jgi:TolB protein